jgi:hypothetical protein
VAEQPVDFDPVRMIEALERHRVRHVLIGGIAARLAGAPIVTGDLDLTPAMDIANLDGLVAALAELEATFRIGAVTTNEPITADVISANEQVQASTPHGDLDIVARPAGTSGFDDLRRTARRVEVAPGVTVAVASLADVIRSKQAAGRPKDQGQLPILRQTLERLTDDR